MNLFRILNLNSIVGALNDYMFLISCSFFDIFQAFDKARNYGFSVYIILCDEKSCCWKILFLLTNQIHPAMESFKHLLNNTRSSNEQQQYALIPTQDNYTRINFSSRNESTEASVTNRRRRLVINLTRSSHLSGLSTLSFPLSLSHF